MLKKRKYITPSMNVITLEIDNCIGATSSYLTIGDSNPYPSVEDWEESESQNGIQLEL